MLATLMPLFDEKMEVCAYSVFAQKENYLLNPSLLGVGRLDAASNIDGLEIINTMGLETVTDDKSVFVEVNNISIFTDIPELCKAPHEKVVLLIDSEVTPTDNYVDRIAALRDAGFRFAIRKLSVKQFEEYRPILQQMDYVMLDHKKIDISKAKIYFQKVYPKIGLVALNVDSKDDFDMLTESGGYRLYEGDFFRVPVNAGAKEMAPLKTTYLELLQVVNKGDYDLTEAAAVIEHDPALVISLLKMVNRMTVNSGISSVRHAAAMLGQRELARWINTAVTKELCADRPGAVMRESLLRARFCENLAPLFKLQAQGSEVFLMGLFSILDVIIEKPMAEALDMVRVTAPIRNALLNHEGEYAPLYDFMLTYGMAHWEEISRRMVTENIPMEPVYQAYIDSLEWYRNLFSA
jgi:EAL and modified HD-GYP domain-containing signal transduction protein